MTDGNDAAYACNETRGLTKRELFAAMAMQGLLANNEEWPNHCITVEQIADECGKVSCIYADALIAELNKEQGV